MDWFISEQVEEEKSVQAVIAVIDWLERIGDSNQGLCLMDQQLGGRVSASSEEADPAV